MPGIERFFEHYGYHDWYRTEWGEDMCTECAYRMYVGWSMLGGNALVLEGCDCATLEPDRDVVCGCKFVIVITCTEANGYGS